MNKLIEITKNIQTDIDKAPKTKGKAEEILKTDREITVVSVEEEQMTLRKHEKWQIGEKDGIVTEKIKYTGRQIWHVLANIFTVCLIFRRMP